MDDQSYGMVMNLQVMDARHTNITSESNIIYPRPDSPSPAGPNMKMVSGHVAV